MRIPDSGKSSKRESSRQSESPGSGTAVAKASMSDIDARLSALTGNSIPAHHPIQSVASLKRGQSTVGRATMVGVGGRAPIASTGGPASSGVHRQLRDADLDVDVDDIVEDEFDLGPDEPEAVPRLSKTGSSKRGSGLIHVKSKASHSSLEGSR